MARSTQPIAVRSFAKRKRHARDPAVPVLGSTHPPGRDRRRRSQDRPCCRDSSPAEEVRGHPESPVRAGGSPASRLHRSREPDRLRRTRTPACRVLGSDGLRPLRPSRWRVLRVGWSRRHRAPDAQLGHRWRCASSPSSPFLPARSRGCSNTDQPGRLVCAPRLLHLSTWHARHCASVRRRHRHRLRLLQAICGASWKAAHVQFSHARPKDARPYRRLFGPSVRFNAEVSGIVFAGSWLDRTVPGADPKLRQQVMSAITQASASSTMDFADIVRGALHQMVLSGTSSAESVALLFGIHERTLRKRLATEGTSLQQLVSQTRFELAKQLLENTQLPISEIASALHFADAAVFSRAFRSWSKTSPRDWRARRGGMTVTRADELRDGARQRPV